MGPIESLFLIILAVLVAVYGIFVAIFWYSTRRKKEIVDVSKIALCVLSLFIVLYIAVKVLSIT